MARQRLSPSQGAGIARKPSPSNLDWAHFLGPLKWRDWDPQQYYNWRAYLDFGGGQVTDLFTHWIDVVHMFMGQDIPMAASAAGGVYKYKDGRTAPDTINVLLEYPASLPRLSKPRWCPASPAPRWSLPAREGRLCIDRGRYEFHPVGRNAAADHREGHAPTSTWTTSRTSWSA